MRRWVGWRPAGIISLRVWWLGDPERASDKGLVRWTERIDRPSYTVNTLNEITFRSILLMNLVERLVLKSMQVIPCSDRSQWDYILYPQARKSMKNISENFLGIYSWYFFRKDFRYFIWNLVEESTARVDRNIISLRVLAVGDLRWAAQGLLFGSDSSWKSPPCLLL